MCGRKRKGTDVVQNWQGMWRCPEHNEPRQPQDFVRGVADVVMPPFIQSQTMIFRGVCDPESISAIPDYAGPDCAIPDYISPAFDPSVNESEIL
jgi:hypothetical protein